MCVSGPVFPRQRCEFCAGLSGYKKWPLSFASSSPDAGEFTEDLDTEAQNQNRYSKGTTVTMDRKLFYWIFLFGCLHGASAQGKNVSRLPSFSFYSKDQRMRNLTKVRVSCQFLFDNFDHLQDTWQ